MRHIVNRVIVSILMLVAASILIFVVLRALPGDPVLTRLAGSQGVDQNSIQRLRAEAGLDRPLIAQYFGWVTGILHGDLGQSYFSHQPVAALLTQRIGPTVELTVLAVLLSVVLALPAAVAAAERPGGWADRLVTSFAAAGMSFPPFVAGIALILIFSVGLHWLPARGYTPLTTDPVQNLRDMTLPAIALAIGAAPLVYRYLKGELITAFDSDYARTAEGKGVPRSRVVVRHALRNAALPSLTMIGLIVGYTLGGSVIVEYAFGISGLGSLSVEAAFRRDYAVLQSVVLLVSALFILVTLAVDVLTGLLDPRTRTRHG
ncbi:ABC transporter permease [Dactylosporangium sp. NPDC051541]|uniref:ABC transporter permease n=1 Tax=Dactylosporangium sp. NPDC051541 TaxID=3363977 RepID=UPI0037A446E7